MGVLVHQKPFEVINVKVKCFTCDLCVILDLFSWKRRHFFECFFECLLCRCFSNGFKLQANFNRNCFADRFILRDNSPGKLPNV